MTPTHPFLLISDDPHQKQYVSNVFQFMQLPIALQSGQSWQALTNDNQDVTGILLSNRLDQSQFNTILRQITDNYQDIPLVILGTPLECQENAQIVDCLADDFTKARLLQTLQRCQTFHDNQLQLSPYNNELDNLVGESQAMQELRRVISQVAGSDTSVLILGESGTGKDVIASSIHRLSSRNQHPFVPVNCGAIPGELMESELFGHEKGAFTGALTKREGRFELANNGTLFLDEIGDMPLAMQVKLLRVLQEHQFERIGSNVSLDVDVRIIAATNQDLELAIQDNRFRQDLYYRLNVFPIMVKPLRQRQVDIPLLIDHFNQLLGKKLQRQIEFTEAALQVLLGYQWPGNIRELANFIERMMILHPDRVIDLEQLDDKFTDQSNASSQSATTAVTTADKVNLKEYIAQTEINLITSALERYKGNVSQAARYLSMGRTTLIEKMRKYQLKATKKEVKAAENTISSS